MVPYPTWRKGESILSHCSFKKKNYGLDITWLSWLSCGLLHRMYTYSIQYKHLKKFQPQSLCWVVNSATREDAKVVVLTKCVCVCVCLGVLADPTNASEPGAVRELGVVRETGGHLSG